MKKVFIGKSKYLRFDHALVDDEDYHYINQWRWHSDNKGYAVRRVNRNGRKAVVYMHREIMQTPEGKVTDHVNGNKIDNQKTNLRICSDGENKRNRGASIANPTGLKGAYWQSQIGRWYSRIQLNRKSIYLGTFDTAELAAEAYDVAAEKYHGEYARLN